MLADDIDLISVDDHVVEPPGVWVDRFPRALRDVVPHVVEVDGHGQDWVYEGRHDPVAILGSPRTRRFRGDGTGDDLWSRHYDDLLPGCFDAAERVKAMDEDGVRAAVNFPSFPRFAGTRFIEADDKDLAARCISAWNDWMIGEWTATAPDRFIPMIMIPLWDVPASVREMDRCAELGARAVTMFEDPSPFGLPSWWTDHWQPLFRCAEANELVLCMHVGTSGALPSLSIEATDAVGISLCGVNSMVTCTDLIFSGRLNDVPGLKIALSEGGSGWVPYLVERMDYTWDRNRSDGWQRELRPSELFRRHFWSCFISDRTAIVNRHAIGIDKLMWECDYPHGDSNWPDSRKLLAEALADVPDDEARQICELNARTLFRFPR